MKRVSILLMLSFLCCCSPYHCIAEEYYTPFFVEYGEQDTSAAIILSMYTNSKSINLHSETYLSIIFFDSDSKLFGFIDKNSNTYHPAEWSHIYDLFCRDSTQPILVELQDGSCKYIDRMTNIESINMLFTLYGKESEFRNQYAVVYYCLPREGVPHLIDVNGYEVCFPTGIIPTGAVQNNGLLIISTLTDSGDRLYGIGDCSGNIVFEPQFDHINEYNNGYASVRLGDLWGHIDENGIIKIFPTFALCEEDNYGYFFDEQGKATFELNDGRIITITEEPVE